MLTSPLLLPPVQKHGVLVCVPFGQDAAMIGRVLAAAGIQCTVCMQVAELLEQINRGADALLVGEEVVTGPALDELAAAIASQPTWSNLPVLLLSRSGAGSLEVQQAAITRLGDVTLVERPVRTLALVTTVRAALRSRQRQYQMHDADRRKDEFLAILSHELRNPLAPIKNAIAILGQKNLQEESADLPALRGIVERQVVHLTRLVDDLLDVARITSGKVILKKSSVALPLVIRHAIELATQGLLAKNHQLVLCPAKPPDVLLDADPARLVQSIANLLSNAAKFTPAGGSITLHMSADPASGELKLRVQDNGIGLASESLSRIFELFAQAPLPGEPTTGLGIGLSLAQQFAQLHGGTLDASSPGLGQGSTFSLCLPVVLPVGVSNHSPLHCPADVPQEQPAVTAIESLETSAVPQLPQKVESDSAHTVQRTRVLVVDDNPDAANTLNMLLDLDGFAVTTVYDGAQAVAAVDVCTPDIVVMDIGMPQMDGYEAARQMRQRHGRDSLLLIALTGWGQASDIDRAMAAGFDYHMVKPVDYEQLLQCFGGSVQRLAHSVA